MKPGDLVKIEPSADYLDPDTPRVGIVLRPTSLMEDGDLIIGFADWWLLWNGDEMAFPAEDLEVISEGR